MSIAITGATGQLGRLVLASLRARVPAAELIALVRSRARAADLDAAYAALQARGVEFVDEPHRIARLPDHERWMVFLRDPDEHLLALMVERPLSQQDAA